MNGISGKRKHIRQLHRDIEDLEVKYQACLDEMAYIRILTEEKTQKIEEIKQQIKNIRLYNE